MSRSAMIGYSPGWWRPWSPGEQGALCSPSAPAWRRYGRFRSLGKTCDGKRLRSGRWSEDRVWEVLCDVITIGKAKAKLPKRSTHKMTTQQTLDLAAIKGRQQKAWSAGDYGRVGVTLTIMGELLAEAVDPKPGQRVLDVARGNGE